MPVHAAHVYDQPAADDGRRVLVDRLWPRGLSKARARLDGWCKQVAPSAELRTWYGHDPDLFSEFAQRYRAELAGADRCSALADLVEIAGNHSLTLLTAVREIEISHAAVLVKVISER
jgi:uncharacterized protein YeaO (DUF488 family)